MFPVTVRKYLCSIDLHRPESIWLMFGGSREVERCGTASGKDLLAAWQPGREQGTARQSKCLAQVSLPFLGKAIGAIVDMISSKPNHLSTPHFYMESLCEFGD